MLMDKFFEQTLPAPGNAKRINIPSAKAMPVFLHRPKVERNPNQMIVAVHGISRNSRQQLEAFQPVADKLGVWLLVPTFSKLAFGQYQQLYQSYEFARADLALNLFLMAWRSWRRLQHLKIHLSGYSGGAQFAHRYAMTYPQFVESLHLSSAGWYTFPDPLERYPRGLDHWPRMINKPRLEEFYHIPILVMVGECDTKRDASLRKTAKIDLQQGLTRVERACRWFEAVSAEKQKVGVVDHSQLLLLLGEVHDFCSNIQEGSMLPALEAFWSNFKRG